MADSGVQTQTDPATKSQKVISWNDHSGHEHHVVSIAREPFTLPSFVPSVGSINHKPAITFSGMGESNFKGAQALIGQIRSPFELNTATVFIVGKWDRKSAMAPLTLGPSADSRTGRGGLAIRRGSNANGWLCWHNGGDGSGENIQTQEPPLDADFHALSAIFDKSRISIRMFVDGLDQKVPLRNSAPIPMDPVRYIQIGGQGIMDAPGAGSEWFFGGQIAEIIVYNRVLSSAPGPDTEKNEMNAVNWYLQEKYGLRGSFILPEVPIDSDGDGILDGYERRHVFLDENDPADALLDQDSDGLSNLKEFQIESRPDVIDSDQDGLNDGAEVNLYTTNPNHADSDADGLSDLEEVDEIRTSPILDDTDGDLFPDGYELFEKSDPLNAKDHPRTYFQVHEKDIRIGTMAVAKDGALLLFEDDPERRIVVVQRSEDDGKSWEKQVVVGKMVKLKEDMSDDGRYRRPTTGWSEVGNVIVDENTGDIMVFASSLMSAQILYRSKDNGSTWKTERIRINPDKNGWISAILPSCDPGITLRHGTKKGRLLVPARVFVGYLNKGKNQKHFKDHYSNALYSDDGGKTWTPSTPFPLGGTGEASLVELSDGRIYYNSRTHSRPGNRRIAWSLDAGESLTDEHEDDELWDGPPDVYGCKAGLLRLPYEDRDILLFSSPGSRSNRIDITVWVSFDGGQTWPHQKLVRTGPGNYTWLAAGRKNTPSEGKIYLLANKDWIAAFNLPWLMQKPE
jgi:sialidase-1